MDGELEHLGERIAEQAAHLDAATHRLLVDLREFDTRGGWHRQGALSCAHWLSWRVGWSLVVARDHLRVAHKLAELPAIDDALRRGEVSYSKVRAMTRVATSANEQLLLEYARLMPAAQLEITCRKYAMVQRHGKDPHPLGDLQRRYVRRRDMEDGMVKIEAVLHPDEAEVVWTMLDRAATQLAREPKSRTKQAASAGDSSEGSTEAQPRPGRNDARSSNAIQASAHEVRSERTVPACALISPAHDSAESHRTEARGPVTDNPARMTAASAAGDSAESTCAAMVGHGGPAQRAIAPRPMTDNAARMTSAIAAAAPGAARGLGNVPTESQRVERGDTDIASDSVASDRVASDRVASDRVASDSVASDHPREARSLLDELLDELDVSRGGEPVPADDRGAGGAHAASDRGESPLRQREDAVKRSFNRADALVAVAQGYLRGDQANRSPIEVTLTIPVESLRGGAADPLEVGEMGGSFVSCEAARRLSCDCGVVEVIEDENGTPLSVGRKRRTITGQLRRALHARDKTCTFPGCTNRLFLEGHHIKHWVDGGETSLSNAALLCSNHHHHVHEYGYSIELGPDGRPQFRDPHGWLVKAVPERPVAADVGWPRIRAQNAPLAIDAETIACEWDGRPVPYGAVIGHLVAADGLQ